MNILLAIQNLQLGGAERQVIELAHGLKGFGHKVTICCLNSLGPLAKDAQRQGLDVVCLNKRNKFDVFVVYRFANLIKQKKTEVLQTFLFGADLWGRLAGRLAGVKVLLTSNRAGGLKKGNIELWADRLLWSLADGLISNTTIGKELISKNAKIPLEYVSVLHNGMDLSRFDNMPKKEKARQVLGISLQCKIVIIVGTVKPVKNHKMMVRVTQRLKAVYPNVRILVIGGSIKDWDKEIKQYAEQADVSENLMFLGQRTDVPETLAAADAGILCSLSEGFPNAIMEYMAAGLPVVATDVGGVRDLITPDATGYLVPSDDDQAMAQRLLDLFKDPVKAGEMGQAGRRWVRENCDFMQLARKTEAVYREIYQRKTGLVRP